MTTEPFVEAYFEWLAAQAKDESTTRSYRDVLMIMFNTEFVWQVANDDNRLADGRDLRREFKPGWDWPAPVNVLEVLIGLSRRLEFQVGGSAPGWAWILMKNLELDKMHDRLGARRAARVEEILFNLIWRRYQPDGQGGFFPLAWPDEDQTKIEIWYQMAAYINEMHPEY